MGAKSAERHSNTTRWLHDATPSKWMLTGNRLDIQPERLAGASDPENTRCEALAAGVGAGSYVRFPPIADISRCRHSRFMATIYMPLLGEGVDVWRPVEATPVGDHRYRVESTPAEDEEWAFATGSIVRCERRSFSDDDEAMAVVALAD